MAEAYATGGLDAGNAIMQKPVTGFDALADDLVDHMQNFVAPIKEKNAKLKQAVTENAAELSLIIILINVLSTLGLIITLFIFGRMLFKRLGAEPAEMLTIASNIANGKLNNTIVLKQGDTSSLLSTLNIMQTSLHDNMVTIKPKVDNTLINMMIKLKSAAF